MDKHGQEDETSDEAAYATNWTRAFKHLYRNIKWLNSYAVMNSLAAQKISDKFMKVYFEQTDNILDKNLQMHIDGLMFSKKEQLGTLSADIKKVVANYFAEGDI